MFFVEFKKNVTPPVSLCFILFSYQIVKNSLKVVIRRSDLLHLDIALNKERGQKAKKLVPVVGLNQETILSWSEMNLQDIIFTDEP